MEVVLPTPLTPTTRIARGILSKAGGAGRESISIIISFKYSRIFSGRSVRFFFTFSLRLSKMRPEVSKPTSAAIRISSRSSNSSGLIRGCRESTSSTWFINRCLVLARPAFSFVSNHRFLPKFLFNAAYSPGPAFHFQRNEFGNTLFFHSDTIQCLGHFHCVPPVGNHNKLNLPAEQL